ncbi:transposable element Tc1 transposase [Trichonephila clavipes]|nr:transposable element Tc1 transposase [Trichonephila clavipes]
MPRHRIRAHYEQLPAFKRGRVIGLKEACCANRRITHPTGQSDAVIRRCWQERVGSGRLQLPKDEPKLHSHQPPRHLPLTTAHYRAGLQWCLARSGRNHADWVRIALSNESRFQLYPAFTIARHPGPPLGVRLCQTLSWPARLSDLSLIEHVWDRMGRRLYILGNVDDLAGQLEQIWQEMLQETMRKRYHSMLRRLVICIQARGGSTTY